MIRRHAGDGAWTGHVATLLVGCCWLAASACDADNGRGSISGAVVVPACRFPAGAVESLEQVNPSLFDHAWNYFVGETFDVRSERFPQKQLNIRVQSSAVRWEVADSVTFWVQDSYEVARCLRHRTNADGTPDWDPMLCDGSAGALGANGEGRVLIGTEFERVSSHFVLPDSCPDAFISADALGSCSGGTCPLTLCPGHGSWIIFTQFGNTSDAPGRDFKVNNGEAIEASAFHLELCDGATVQAERTFVMPVPQPAITGAVEGSFFFVLKS